MCTISKGIIYPVRDLICFKVMFQNEDGTLASPYHRMDWKVGKTERTYATSPRSQITYAGTVFLGESFHTFQYVKDAVSTKHDLEMCGGYAYDVKSVKVVVCKCTIPKDCQFIYEGEQPDWSGHVAPCYVSEALTIDEIIDDSKFAKL